MPTPAWARGLWARRQTLRLELTCITAARSRVFLEVLFGSQAPRAFGMYFGACVVASRWDGPTEVDHDRSQGKPARP
jgi:hypothetical protein